MSSEAQELNTDFPHYSVGVSLIHWLDPLMPGPHLYFEKRMDERKAWRLEAGLILNYESGLDRSINIEIIELEGLRVRYGRRWYKSTSYRSQPFIGFDVSYRYLDGQIAGDFSFEDFSYLKRINYTFRQHTIDLTVPLGNTWALSEHWMVDFSLGVGLRTNIRTTSGAPEDAQFVTNGSLRWEYETENGVSDITLTVPMVFAIRYLW